MSARIAIIDSGGANIASLLYAFDRLSAAATVTTNADIIRSAARVLLPGVGSAGDAMQRLRDAKLLDVIRKLTQPVLGICLGMQLLAEASEEENVECLGVIPGVAAKLPANSEHPVPNMGWCRLSRTAEHPLVQQIDDQEFFYFLHSYALPVDPNTVASAQHANSFSAIACRNNFVAAQFHPERSSTAGSQLLRNFLDWGA